MLLQRNADNIITKMPNLYSVVFFCIAVFLAIDPLAPLRAETLRIDEAATVMPVSLDVPKNWVKNQLVKENGVIYTLRSENAEIEIRSFVFNDVDMDYIIHAKASRMYSKYSYINILLEKEETIDEIRKKTIFWKLRYQNKTYFEKTVILQYLNNIVILSCVAPEDEYPHHRVIFENAVLSLKYEKDQWEPVEPPVEPVKDDIKKDETKQDDADKKEISKEMLENLQKKDQDENTISKDDKLKKKEETK